MCPVGWRFRVSGSGCMLTCLQCCLSLPLHLALPRRRDEALLLPQDLDYASLQLSGEDREKLSAVRPASLAAAQRIPGVTPSALLLLLQHVRRQPARAPAAASAALGAAGTGARAAGE